LPHYQIILTRDKGLDQIEVQLEVTADVFSDKVTAMENVQRQVTHAIEHTLGLRVKLRLLEPQTIDRSQGKAKRVIDHRKNGR